MSRLQAYPVEPTDAELHAKLWAGVRLTEDEWAILIARQRHYENRACMPQVEALLAAGWRFELPDVPDPDPWQWYWRRPPRRKGSKGMFFWSTQQAYNALMRERVRKP